MKKNLKIAIVHDYIKEYGGAEAVLETLIDTFPQAQVFTTLYFPSFFGPHRERFESKLKNRIHTSFLQFIPFSHKIISPLRLLSPLAFKSFDFSRYDIILSSATGAYFPNSLNKKTARLICYCHTPPRYLYGLPTARNFQNNPVLKPIINLMNHFLRLADFSYSQNVDQYLSNSATTSQRIQKFYHRDSVIIHPPIDLPVNFKPQTKKQEYFLTGGRLARAKRYDVAIEACKLLNVPLKIFGRDFAGYESELRKLAGLSAVASAKEEPSIEFLGEITLQTKVDLFAHAKAFLFCSDNEDFGMIPVEAMAYGCPVVAYKSGGVMETVIDGKSGYFFDDLNPKSCSKAIQKIIDHKINPINCIDQASNFSRQKFIDKIKKVIIF